MAYPCVVEFCLQADIFAFLFVLRAEDLQLFGLQRRLDIGGVWGALACIGTQVDLWYVHGKDGDIFLSMYKVEDAGDVREWFDKHKKVDETYTGVRHRIAVGHRV